MSQSERKRESARDARKLGEDKRKERRLARQARRGGQATRDWGDSDPVRLHSLVYRATCAGAGVLFGTTRDGGALVVTIYVDGEAEKEYLRPSDDLDEILEDLALSFPSPGTGSPHTPPGRPQEGQQGTQGEN